MHNINIMMGYKRYLWHLDLSEEENLLEAHYIYSLTQLGTKELGRKYVKLLDVPCGIGRHHKYLRGYGLDVYGIDAEEELISICLERYSEYRDRYMVMDMRKIAFEDEFDIILNWYTSFGYFTHEENVEVLERFYRALRRKGILILDAPSYWNPMLGASTHNDKYIEITSLKEIEKHRFHFKAKLYEEREDRLIMVDKIELTIYIYPPETLKKILEEAGFKILYAFRGRTFRHISLENLDLYNALRGRVGRIVWLIYKP
jgi:SAM-dependent methyltransferase